MSFEVDERQKGLIEKCFANGSPLYVSWKDEEYKGLLLGAPVIETVIAYDKNRLYRVDCTIVLSIHVPL